jgi:hypothetical protein
MEIGGRARRASQQRDRRGGEHKKAEGSSTFHASPIDEVDVTEMRTLGVRSGNPSSRLG